MEDGLYTQRYFALALAEKIVAAAEQFTCVVVGVVPPDPALALLAFTAFSRPITVESEELSEVVPIDIYFPISPLIVAKSASTEA